MAINIRDLIPAGRRKAVLAAMKQPGEAEVLDSYRAHRITKDGQTVEASRHRAGKRDRADIRHCDDGKADVTQVEEPNHD